MSKAILLGFSGKARCGKTTISRLITEQVPGAVILSFADALRELVADMCGYRIEFVRKDVFKACTHRLGGRELSGRELLQYTGCLVREINPGHWVNCMERKIRSLEDSVPLICVDDVRFPDELELIERLGGPVLRLDPHADWTPGEHSGHISETALDGYGFQRRYAPCYGALGSLADAILESLKPVRVEFDLAVPAPWVIG